MEQRLTELYKIPDMYTVLEKFTGKDLKGKSYTPLFDYFANLKTGNANIFTVLNNTFVTIDQGTGVVHQAPYFGEVIIIIIFDF